VRRLNTPLILVLLFLAAWLPRAVALERFVTIDERKWLARSANFYQAVTHGEWGDTFQREHPGVTVMWAGTLALLLHYPTYAQEAPGQFAWEREYFEAWLGENTSFTPLELLAAGRRVIVFVISLAIAASYLPLRRLLGAPLALAATLFVAWDPFAIALSQQLHPDGFVAVLAFLALALFLTWLYDGQNWRDLIVAGVVMGLAWLTKTPAIFLVPTAALLLAIAYWRVKGWGVGSREWGISAAPHSLLPTPYSPTPILQLVGPFVTWGLIATATFVLLWPAMWVDPLGTLRHMGTEMGEYVERHTTVNYFLGRPVDDPGPFFYPVAFLWRASPAVLIGLIVALIAAIRQAWPFNELRIRQTALGLLVFALVLTAGMTLGAKKFDRYLLPAFPALAVIATLGWAALVKWGVGSREWGVGSGRTASLLPIPYSLLPIIFLLHGLPGFVHYPYYLTFYNPLVGGARTAPYVLFAGWGEGLDEAARWLNTQPDAERLRVVAWYADGPFSYFFRGQSVEVGYSSPLYWLDTDYTVLYINQWQRQLPSPEAIAYFAGQTPAHTVTSGGLELVRIYDLRATLLPDFVEIGKTSAADFGGQIRLSAYDVPQQVVQPGDTFQMTLFLQSLAPMTVNYNALIRLVDPTGAELWRADGWPWGAPTTDWPLRQIRPDGHTVTIPPDAAPGLYKLTISFYDPGTFEPLPVTEVRGSQALDPGTRDFALLWVGDPPDVAAPGNPPWQFGDQFTLLGAQLPAQAQPGADLALRLDWQGLAQTATDYTTFVHIVDAAGVNTTQQDGQPLVGFAPTRLWTPGLRLVDERFIPLPEDLAPGVYEVRVGLYTLEAGRLPVMHGGQPVGDSVVVGQFTVR
jgi:hypothetical protein